MTYMEGEILNAARLKSDNDSLVSETMEATYLASLPSLRHTVEEQGREREAALAALQGTAPRQSTTRPPAFLQIFENPAASLQPAARPEDTSTRRMSLAPIPSLSPLNLAPPDSSGSQTSQASEYSMYSAQEGPALAEPSPPQSTPTFPPSVRPAVPRRAPPPTPPPIPRRSPSRGTLSPTTPRSGPASPFPPQSAGISAVLSENSQPPLTATFAQSSALPTVLQAQESVTPPTVLVTPPTSTSGTDNGTSGTSVSSDDLPLSIARLRVSSTPTFIPSLASTTEPVVRIPNPRTSNRLSMAVSIAPSTYECPLCFEPEDDLSNIPCGHTFCTPCISELLGRENQCPLCRAPARKEDMRRVYLNT